MSIFARSSKRGTSIRLTGHDANNFVNALLRKDEKQPPVNASMAEGVKLVTDASPDAACTALNQSQCIPNGETKDTESRT